MGKAGHCRAPHEHHTIKGGTFMVTWTWVAGDVAWAVYQPC